MVIRWLCALAVGSAVAVCMLRAGEPLRAQAVATTEQRTQAAKVLTDITDVQNKMTSLQDSATSLQGQVEPLLTSASHGVAIPPDSGDSLPSELAAIQQQWQAAQAGLTNLAIDAAQLDPAQASSGGAGGAAAAGGGSINWNGMISTYQNMTNQVDQDMQQIGNVSSGGVQMEQLFQLQMAMNELTLFGQTLTNVNQGIQQVAISISRNTGGS